MFNVLQGNSASIKDPTSWKNNNSMKQLHDGVHSILQASGLGCFVFSFFDDHVIKGVRAHGPRNAERAVTAVLACSARDEEAWRSAELDCFHVNRQINLHGDSFHTFVHAFHLDFHKNATTIFYFCRDRKQQRVLSSHVHLLKFKNSKRVSGDRNVPPGIHGGKISIRHRCIWVPVTWIRLFAAIRRVNELKTTQKTSDHSAKS